MARRSVTIVASDGKSERISWYDGATEGAVVRCALLALDLPATRTAHLLWQPGEEAVDFGKPITDGVTLYLEATRDASPPSQDGGGSLYSSGGGHGAVRPDAGVSVSGGGAFSVATGGSAVAQRRINSSASTAPADDGGARDPQGRRRRLPPRRESSRSSSSERRRALLMVRRFFGVRSGGAGGLLNRFLDRATSSAADSDEELERRPLLGIGRSSSSMSLLSPSSSSSPSSRGAPGGGRGRGSGGGGGGGGGGASEEQLDGDGGNPDHQRDAILKLKRINAHLANERTLLAWVRCVGKMFTAGVLSLSLAGSAGNRTYSLCFVGMGMVYIAMGPYVVFVGASRFHQVAEVMQGSVHDAFSYFSGGHLRGLSFLMMALATLSMTLMATELLASA